MVTHSGFHRRIEEFAGGHSASECLLRHRELNSVDLQTPDMVFSFEDEIGDGDGILLPKTNHLWRL